MKLLTSMVSYDITCFVICCQNLFYNKFWPLVSPVRCVQCMWGIKKVHRFHHNKATNFKFVLAAILTGENKNG